MAANCPDAGFCMCDCDQCMKTVRHCYMHRRTGGCHLACSRPSKTGSAYTGRNGDEAGNADTP